MRVLLFVMCCFGTGCSEVAVDHAVENLATENCGWKLYFPLEQGSTIAGNGTCTVTRFTDGTLQSFRVVTNSGHDYFVDITSAGPHSPNIFEEVSITPTSGIASHSFGGVTCTNMAGSVYLHPSPTWRVDVGTICNGDYNRHINAQFYEQKL